MRKIKLLAAALVLCAVLPCSADDRNNAPDQSATVSSFDQVVDQVVSHEQAYLGELRKYSPVVETYIQNMRPDPDLGAVPTSDKYFLGRLDMSAGAFRDRSYLKQAGFFGKMIESLTSFYQIHYVPLGFMSMIVVDGQGFDRAHYDFKFLRREFVGNVRCLVIEVSPKKGSGSGRFTGRIWVEDQNYNIVRFNGSYGPAPRFGHYLHFDSWRLNVRPGLWLPAYVYSEESDMPYGFGISRKLRFKSQTRLWGYDHKIANPASEFSTIMVDSPKVEDHSEAAQDASPVQAQREWNRLAEDNVLDRLERAGLLAPAGDIDKVLEQVVTNLVVTNKLDIQPPIRARVLLTDPLESFSVGHTIVISRGLLDVLPDEASLAAVLAHEVAHITLGGTVDSKFAFSDRMMFPDQKVFDRLRMASSKREEIAINTKALTLLQNSPYNDKLAAAGLFLRALRDRQKDLPNLLHAHLGDGMAIDGRLRMESLMQSAPQLQMRNVDQIAALPLGGRVHLDIWSDQVQLAQHPSVPLLSAREKMPFEVTPVYPYVSRFASEEAKQKITAANGGN